jgi:hypothetical protein
MASIVLPPTSGGRSAARRQRRTAACSRSRQSWSPGYTVAAAVASERRRQAMTITEKLIGQSGLAPHFEILERQRGGGA